MLSHNNYAGSLAGYRAKVSGAAVCAVMRLGLARRGCDPASRRTPFRPASHATWPARRTPCFIYPPALTIRHICILSLINSSLIVIAIIIQISLFSFKIIQSFSKRLFFWCEVIIHIRSPIILKRNGFT